MTESPAAIVYELADWCRRLQALADDEHDALVDSADQLTVENAIAAGIAILADEAAPPPATQTSPRQILARDLWITTDLVRRALESTR